jgi:hypothetical protein
VKHSSTEEVMVIITYISTEEEMCNDIESRTEAKKEKKTSVVHCVVWKTMTDRVEL